MYSILVLLSVVSWGNCLNPDIQEKYEKLSRDDFIEYFNKENFSWKIKKNDFVTEAMMNSVELSPSTLPVKQTEKDSVQDLPENFHAFKKWRYCYSIPDYVEPTENCSSHWAISAAGVAADRYCTANGLGVIFRSTLSYIDLTCCKTCFSKSFCSGGNPEEALLFWQREGLVKEYCKEVMPADEKCVHACDSADDYYLASKTFASSIYRLTEDDLEIRKDLFTYGPVLATFAVYEDFKDYKEGIYEHTHGKLVGHHSVRVVGYGVSDGVPYWIAVNSWGLDWGKAGAFLIKRGQPDLGFEKNMVGVFPRILH